MPVCDAYSAADSLRAGGVCAHEPRCMAAAVRAVICVGENGLVVQTLRLVPRRSAGQTAGIDPKLIVGRQMRNAANRRKAALADSGLGRLNWADCGPSRAAFCRPGVCSEAGFRVVRGSTALDGKWTCRYDKGFRAHPRGSLRIESRTEVKAADHAPARLLTEPAQSRVVLRFGPE